MRPLAAAAAAPARSEGLVVADPAVSTSPPPPNSALKRRKYDGRGRPIEVAAVSDDGFLTGWAMPGVGTRRLFQKGYDLERKYRRSRSVISCPRRSFTT